MTVNWFKDGAAMKASRNIKLNYIARTGEVTVASEMSENWFSNLKDRLHIFQVKFAILESVETDSANYKCVASNQHGENSLEATLNVIGQCPPLYQASLHVSSSSKHFINSSHIDLFANIFLICLYFFGNFLQLFFWQPFQLLTLLNARLSSVFCICFSFSFLLSSEIR